MAAVIAAEEVAAPMQVEVEASPAKDDTLAARLPEEVAKVLQGLDLESTTLGKVRVALEVNLGLQYGALDEHKDAIKQLLQDKIQEMQAQEQDKENIGEEAVADSQEAQAETPPPKQNKDKKRRRLMEAAIRLAKKCRRGDTAGGDEAVVKQPELEGIDEPLEVEIGGVKVKVPLKTLYSGRKGFHAYQPVTVMMNGRQVELNCMVTCAVSDVKDLAVLQAELATADAQDAKSEPETAAATEETEAEAAKVIEESVEEEADAPAATEN